MYKRIIPALLLLFSTFPLISFGQTGYKWLVDGGSTNFVEFAIDVDTDAEGNIYVGGEFADAAFLWDSTYTANGDNDMFLAKFDPYGNIEWVETFGGPQLDRIYAIDAGPDGTVFVTGYGKITFNGPPPAGPRHARDIIVARFDSQGNRIWGEALDGDVFSEGTDVLGNSLGECYISSRMETVTYFNNDTLVGNGNEDGMVVKFGPSGNHLWSLAMGGTLEDEYYAIGMDGQENLVAGGYFRGTATTGGQTLNGVDGEDACLVKMDSSGNVLWAVEFTGTGDEKITGVRCAEDGSIYFCGVFDGNINVGGTNLTATASQDIFYGKANPNGSVVWAKKAGGSSLGFAEDLEIDAEENLYIGGFYFGTFVVGSTSVTSAGADDLYFMKVDSTGSLDIFETSHYFDTRDVFGIAVDAQQNVLICGSYIGQLELGTDTVQSMQGSMDVFVAKYASLSPAIVLDSVTGPGGTCVDSALNLHYHLEGYFDQNNFFTGELSSATGSFASPFVVAGATTGVGGTLNGAVPLLAPNGTGYRARIKSNSPTATSNNSPNLTINGQLSPPLIISDDTVVCNGSSVLPTIPGGYASQIWSTGATTPFANLTTPGPYWVTATDMNGCTQTFSFTLDECVGLESEQLGSMVVFPNPGNGHFKLQANSSLTGLWDIALFDLNGKSIYRTELETFASEWTQELNLSSLNPGIYFLRTSLGEHVWTQKLIVRK